MLPVLLYQRQMIQRVILIVPAAGIGAVMPGSIRWDGAMVKRNHIRPDFIYVDIIGVVVHIRRESASRAHIHLQADHVPHFAQSVLILVEHEEFQMHEPAAHAERLHSTQSCVPDIRRQLLDNIVKRLAVVVHNVHQGMRRHIAGFENGIPLRVNDGVKGFHMSPDILLHDIDILVHMIDEEAQILVAFQPVGMAGPHAVVRLHYHGIADHMGKFLRVLVALHQMISGRGDTRLGVVFLHGGFQLDALHILPHKAGGDVELRPQVGVPGQPVLVIGFQPIDFPVFVAEKRHSPEHFVIIFQIADLIIFMQRVPQVLGQLPIGAVADPQYAHTVLFQLRAEFPIAGWEIGADEDEIFHNDPLSF